MISLPVHSILDLIGDAASLLERQDADRVDVIKGFEVADPRHVFLDAHVQMAARSWLLQLVP